VALITPFNFPLEIPALQLMGALYMGNKPVLKVDSKVSRRCPAPLPRRPRPCCRRLLTP
jgi:acyl-CoA reductase-like NAD-dependent aldehyde dehydrogenase